MEKKIRDYIKEEAKKTINDYETFISIAEKYAETALQLSNQYLQQLGLTIAINKEYDDWEDNSLGGAIGCYEADSVFSGEISIGFNFSNLYKAIAEQIDMFPNTSQTKIVREIIYTNVFHEMGHGIIEQINDYLQNTDELDDIYDNNKSLFDSVLDNEEKSVEDFAWDFYDGLLKNNDLDKIVKLTYNT